MDYKYSANRIDIFHFLLTLKESGKEKAPEKTTSAFFGKMPQASRSQKRLKFTPFPVCPRAPGMSNSLSIDDLTDDK